MKLNKKIPVDIMQSSPETGPNPASRQFSMKKYLTPKEVAEILMVSPVTLRQWSQKGMLKFRMTPGGHRRYLATEVEAFKEKYGTDRFMEETGAIKILIVDDDASLREMLSITISTYLENAVVEMAADGFEAGSKIQAFRPDVVLLDLMMPGINGLEVCKRIKSDEKTRGTRVIAMTGYPTDENVRAILEAGADECLAKPFDRSKLIEILKTSAVAGH